MREAFEASPYSVLHDLQFIAGLPEHKVWFPPAGARPSQNDLFVLGKGSAGLVSIAVEGKVSESFDKLVSEWKAQMAPGKDERLGFLCQLLDIDRKEVDAVRYQLLHRTASALLEAERFCAGHALMLVHSFSQTHEWFEDYAKFGRLLGVEVKVGGIHHVGTKYPGGRSGALTAETNKRGGVELYLGWVMGGGVFDEVDTQQWGQS